VLNLKTLVDLVLIRCFNEKPSFKLAQRLSFEGSLNA
jgi:hypothetical protein